MNPLVTVVGSLNIDTVLTVDRHPSPGETVMGHEITDRPGGKGANQVLASSRTGVHTRIVGRTGADAAGREYREALSTMGVDVQHLLETPGASSGRALVCVDRHAQNNIIVVPGANAALTAEDIRAAETSIADSNVILLQLETPYEAVKEALLIARKHSVVTVLNASPVTPMAAALADLADVVIVNEHERSQLPDVLNPCVTLGSRGATWHGLTCTPSPAAVVDTTGAGDAFAGTLAAYLAMGADPKEALAQAVTSGTEATTWTGAQPWNFTRGQLSIVDREASI